MDAPHGGRFLRLRIQSGETPTARELRGAQMHAQSADGETSCTCFIESIALFGGRAHDERLARTGRIDVHIEGGGDADKIDLTWQISGPVG